MADEGWVGACAGPLLRSELHISYCKLCIAEFWKRNCAIYLQYIWSGIEVILCNIFAIYLVRYRKEIGAEEICIVCDIKKKHSAHAVTADVRFSSFA